MHSARIHSSGSRTLNVKEIIDIPRGNITEVIQGHAIL